MEKKNHLIRNKLVRIHVFTGSPEKDAKGNYINTGGLAGSLVLMPGINALTAAEHKMIVGHPEWAQMVEDEQMEEVSVPVSEKSDGYVLSSLDSKKAIKLVKETVKHEVLEEWLRFEKRGDVLKAIGDQLDAVKPPPPKQDEDSDANGTEKS